MAHRILIAEDEPSIVTSLEFLLKEAGYEVAVARNGTEALAMAGKWRPDLIVLDVMMPGVNGFEVCRRIRDNHEMKDTKILMLTARGRETEKGMTAGATAYMTKPFATKELMGTVGKILGD